MYQVLYRKWRPQTFSDVVGQPHVTASLSGAVKNGRLSHAYLFTGSRGTGKTSCAKILAKAVNCEHPVNGNPCNACDTCRGIDNGSILDVIEIDAASNNGVDNIRDLREEANYTPTAAKYRVYIIDEVHMLSTGAFNALLKTLEEPPEHVKFILATTEVHKLPSTILSRCQRFDFKRIEPQDIAARLLYVANEEGIALTEDGARLIARIADGAMRDALSLLDRCAAYGGEINEAVVSDAAGLAGREYLFALTEAVATRDSAKTLSLLNDLYNNACNMERLLADLLSHFRNMMLARSVPNYKDLIVCPQAELESIAVQAQSFTLARILSAMDMLNETAVRLKAGANGRTAVEMALLRLADPQLDTDIAALTARVAELERRLDTGAFQAPVKANTVTENAEPSAPKSAPAPQTPAVQAVQKPTQPEAGVSLPSAKSAGNPETVQKAPVAPPADAEFSKWVEALERLATIDRPLVPHMQNSSAVVRGDLLLIKSENPMLERFLQTGSHANCIVRAVYDVTGVKYKLGIFNSNQAAPNGGTQPQTPKKDPLADLLSRAETLGVQIIEQ
ncbi:MAG: DNA polymerase III subunit gamma/tau [Ruminococcus sp.]|nr:DNA polymerase III subunit gamma/tau [Ruminococcus sp.]